MDLVTIKQELPLYYRADLPQYMRLFMACDYTCRELFAYDIAILEARFLIPYDHWLSALGGTHAIFWRVNQEWNQLEFTFNVQFFKVEVTEKIIRQKSIELLISG